MKTKELLVSSLLKMEKKAFTPMGPSTPPAGGQPIMDPSTMPPGGMPPGGAPMDPSQQGAMPPQGDPSQQGGMPAPGPMMDQNTMMQMMQDPQIQGVLQQAGITMGPQGPVDAQTGQVIPPDQMSQILTQLTQGAGQPAPQDASAAGTPLTLEAFMQVIPQIIAASKEPAPASNNEELVSRIEELEQTVASLMEQISGSTGQSAISPSEVGAMPVQEPVPTEEKTSPIEEGLSQESADALAETAIPQGPIPPNAVMPPQGMQITASERINPARKIFELTKKLKNHK